jgi:hypothetical protein
MRHYTVYWGSEMPKKTAKPLRVKQTDGRQSKGAERMEMTDRDRDQFLAALNRPTKPLPELERAVRLYTRATREEG